MARGDGWDTQEIGWKAWLLTAFVVVGCALAAAWLCPDSIMLP